MNGSEHPAALAVARRTAADLHRLAGTAERIRAGLDGDDRAAVLDVVRGVACDLDSLHGAARAHGLVRDLDSVRDVARIFGLLVVFVRARIRLHDYDLALDRALDRARDLDLHLELARTRARALTFRLHRHGPHERELDLADDLVRALTRAGAAARGRIADLGGVPDTDAHGASPPATPAVRMAAVAVRVLPTADRPRYRDEYAAELHDMAASGCSRTAQLLHAVGLLRSAWTLRRALREPAPAHRAP